jgi:hypothetical protein
VATLHPLNVLMEVSYVQYVQLLQNPTEAFGPFQPMLYASDPSVKT